jgi:hypothetical protein
MWLTGGGESRRRRANRIDPSYADDCYAQLRRCPAREEPCCWSYTRAFLVSVGDLRDSAGRRFTWFPLGIRHEGMFGHRGLSHSLVFALVVSLIVSFLALPRIPQRWTRFLLLCYFFVVTASHGILDAMTDGGLGVAFFAPFDDTRYLFPFRPIKVTADSM